MSHPEMDQISFTLEACKLTTAAYSDSKVTDNVRQRFLSNLCYELQAIEITAEERVRLLDLASAINYLQQVLTRKEDPSLSLALAQMFLFQIQISSLSSTA